MEKGDRTTHELLLKAVIIVTSVVPRQLPVQMAMAVNTALMALVKNGILCTEPYRVPHAGKITHCLFDKARSARVSAAFRRVDTRRIRRDSDARSSFWGASSRR